MSFNKALAIVLMGGVVRGENYPDGITLTLSEQGRLCYHNSNNNQISLSVFFNSEMKNQKYEMVT